MISKISKYRKKASYLLILGYLTLTLGNIFHYHYLNLNFNLSSEVSDPSSNHLKKYIENYHFVCPIHNNFSSLHNLILGDYDSPDFILPKNNSEIRIENFSPSIKKIYSSNNLRAPPIVISFV